MRSGRHFFADLRTFTSSAQVADFRHPIQTMRQGRAQALAPLILSCAAPSRKFPACAANLSPLCFLPTFAAFEAPMDLTAPTSSACGGSVTSASKKPAQNGGTRGVGQRKRASRFRDSCLFLDGHLRLDHGRGGRGLRRGLHGPGCRLRRLGWRAGSTPHLRAEQFANALNVLQIT